MRRAIALLLISTTLACGSSVRRFRLQDPVWEDPDRNDVPGGPPASYYSGLMADGADQMFFRPLAKLPTLRLPTEAMNVNALDEVPNSAWFQNRIGFYDIPIERFVKGPCDDVPDLDPKNGRWTVVAAKPNGANPGFFIKAPDGYRYLIKFDGTQQPGRPTASDVIGCRLYWAVGYHTTCNGIVYFPEDHLDIDPKAEAEDAYGEDQPITQADIDKVLSKAYRTKDGLLRASFSRFVPGKPIGPFIYEGTRSDDPNDVVPHDERRELRAIQVLAGWLGHFDSREQNTFNVWVKDGDRQYLRHFMIDFGSAFGSRWPRDQISRRLGRSYYFDTEHVLVDLLSLGLWPREWEQLEVNDQEIFGYYDGDTFTSSKWRAGYPNPAFDRLTPRDALWMVRILSRITPAHLRAAIELGRFHDPRETEALFGLMLKRRQRIFEEYLTQYPPLATFRLARRTPDSLTQSLCFEDLALYHQVADPAVTYYKMRFRGGEDLDQELGWTQFTPDPDHPHRSCVVLPIGHKRPAQLAPPDAPDDDPLRYGVLDIFVHQTKSVRPTSAVRLHFYDLGAARGYRLVGVERLMDPVMPTGY